MKNSSILLSVALAGAAGTLFADILFEEDFTNYGDTVPGMVEKDCLRVGNDPIWSHGANLSVRPMEDFELYRKPVALAKGLRGSRHV